MWGGMVLRFGSCCVEGVCVDGVVCNVSAWKDRVSLRYLYQRYVGEATVWLRGKGIEVQRWCVGRFGGISGPTTHDRAGEICLERTVDNTL